MVKKQLQFTEFIALSDVSVNIKKGEVMGNITYYKNNVLIESQEIKATESVESNAPKKDFWDSTWHNLKYIFLKIWEI